MVVARGDYSELANRAMTLLDDPALTKQIVEQARQECLKYSWEAVRDAWMNVYHNSKTLAELFVLSVANK